jgi:antitoxin component of MazEF toxin-antitoxin module
MAVKFARKLKRYGGSYVFAIPPELIKVMHLNVDDDLLVYVDDEKMLCVEKDTKLS